jgi:hypothetical protein
MPDGGAFDVGTEDNASFLDNPYESRSNQFLEGE